MKKQILPLLTTMLLGATAANAQITVTPADFKMPIGTDSAYVFNEIDTAGVVLPTTGANQLWDYSNLVLLDSLAYSFNESDTVAPFNQTTGMYDDLLQLGSNYTVSDIKTYFNESDSGIFITGYHVKQQSIPLNGTNEIVIPEQDVLSVGSHCKYPLNLTETTNETYSATEKLAYELTYSPIYVNAPGEFKRDYNIEHEVMGWGSVILPKTNDTVEGLLLKSTLKTVDSVFLNGTPAPGAMLTGLGMTQGYVTTDVNFSIIAKEFNYPAMNFYTNEGGDTLLSLDAINSSYYIEDEPIDTSSIAKINTTKINAYPNPTNDILNLDLDSKIKVFAEVYNIEGRLVARQAIIENKVNVASLKLGVYFMIVRSENEVLGTAKFIKE